MRITKKFRGICFGGKYAMCAKSATNYTRMQNASNELRSLEVLFLESLEREEVGGEARGPGNTREFAFTACSVSLSPDPAQPNIVQPLYPTPQEEKRLQLQPRVNFTNGPENASEHSPGWGGGDREGPMLPPRPGAPSSKKRRGEKVDLENPPHSLLLILGQK